jgi:hypothetical protein
MCRCRSTRRRRYGLCRSKGCPVFEETGTETIEEAEKAINEAEEIFSIKRRPEDFADEEAIGIIPNSRVRLRKMTYLQPEEWKECVQP